MEQVPRRKGGAPDRRTRGRRKRIVDNGKASLRIVRRCGGWTESRDAEGRSGNAIGKAELGLRFCWAAVRLVPVVWGGFRTIRWLQDDPSVGTSVARSIATKGTSPPSNSNPTEPPMGCHRGAQPCGQERPHASGWMTHPQQTVRPPQSGLWTSAATRLRVDGTGAGWIDAARLLAPWSGG